MTSQEGPQCGTELPPFPTSEKQVLYSVPIIALVKSAQQQHGLRHGDYQRYHQYITRKLRRMRKSLHFQQGNRSKVTPKRLTADMIVDARFIVLKIFEIERSWAYAMQLKAESNSELRKRFQMISRLRKAVLRGSQLMELLNESGLLDAQTKLELRAYTQWIHGILAFELQDWVKAKELLESTRTIYNGLIQTVEEDSRGIYLARIDDIQPQIHYCAYNIGDKSAASDLQRMRTQATNASDELAELQLDQLLNQARASQAGMVTEVNWLGTTIPIRTEKVKMAILTVKECDQELLKTEGQPAKLSLYESALKSCVDAMSAVRDELRGVSDADTAGSVSGLGDKKGTSGVLASAPSSDKAARLQLLYNYLQYLKLTRTVARTLLHTEGALSSPNLEASGQVKSGHGTSAYSKPQELSRLYDTIVQNLQEILALPGVVQHSMGFKELMHAKMSAYRSYRCYYLAFTYFHGKRFAECSALLGRAKRHALEAVHSLSPTTASWTQQESDATPGGTPEKLIQDLKNLITLIEAEDLTCRAAYMLDLSEAGDHTPTTAASETAESDSKLAHKALVDRMDSFLDPKAVEKSLSLLANPFVPLPPSFEPIPVKPVLFDLALNHVNFPSLADKIEKKSDGAKDSGIAGLVRGWLWGGDESKNKGGQKS
ncbi:unnamed protein product [Calicophoron daubneyi]|uniref:Signal recognition particle subunit SRP68 n=1 Tax=Calicophoron daubneyi TaxID=300641 RepID=A0AAV2TWQ4_CALDB